MDSTTIRRGVNAGTCLAALGALWTLTRFLPGVEYVVVPVVATGIAVALLALVDGDGSPILLGIPALMAALVGSTDEQERLLAFGVVLVVCLLAAGWRWSEEARVTVTRGIVLLAAGLGPALFLPLDGKGAVAAGLSGIGAVAIVAVSSRERRVGVDVVMIAFCIALAAPAMPARAALFPFLVAALILLLRWPGAHTAALFVLLALAAGKWYLPLLLAAAAGFAALRLWPARQPDREGSPVLAVPLLSGFPGASVAALSVAPDAWSRRRGLRSASTAVALLLAGGSLFVQPSLATIYALTAIACLLCVEERDRWSATLLAFVLVMSGLTAWSGAIASAFPVPVALVVVVLLALAGLAGDGSGGRGGWSAMRSAVVAGLAAAIVLLHPTGEPQREVVASEFRVSSGESIPVELPDGTVAVRLVLAGGNVAHLKGGVEIARVRLEPGGSTRSLKIGDLGDWGANRDEQFLSANNPRLFEPAGPILGAGREAFLSGAGTVRIETQGGTRLVIEALPAIGDEGSLIVDSVEVEK